MKTPKTKRPLLPVMLALALACTGLGSGEARAQQGLFSPRVIVNDRAVTQYELDQRARFLQLLRAPGNLEEEALKALIEDRLRDHAAGLDGIELTEDQVRGAMEEFAGRANLTADQLIEELGNNGVAAETFRDFVSSGLAWREVVRARFGRQAQVTDLEIDRAIAAIDSTTGVRVLIAEIVIPAPPGQEDAAMALAAGLQRDIRTESAFGAAARQYSASPSAGRGGRIDWLPLANLPPAIAPLVLALAPGEVSAPVRLPNAVAVFQLRALDETGEQSGGAQEVEFARFFVPNDDRAIEGLAAVRAGVDTCEDLYGVAKGLPETQLQRETLPLAQVPQEIALELARLDVGESSSSLVQGGNRVLLMLCARRPLLDTPPSRDDVRTQLLNQKLAGFAAGYLADLRDAAIIREP